MQDDTQTSDSVEALGDVRERFVEAAGTRAPVEWDCVFSTLQAKMFGASDAVRIGRFVVESRLGAGAMGVVYAAHDPVLDRRVALKLLRERAGDTIATARIEREARALAKLRHPNVVAVHEVGSHHGDRFIAMDLVEGETLGVWLKPTHTWRQILEIMIGAGRGLAAAHDAGLVHRDFKPDNVLVEDGHARVVDFGLARPEVAADLEATITADGESAEPKSNEVLTRTGAVLGTPAYMAPEAFGGETDARTDQFSYCVTLWEALHGVRPFETESIDGLLEAVRCSALQRGTSRRVPTLLRRVVVRGLSYDPQDRWPSMAALLDALERYARRPRTRRLALAAVGGTLVGAAVVVSTSSDDPSACSRTGERMDDTWSRARRESINAAFGNTNLPYAVDAWAGAAEAIDRYATDWVAMRRQSCEATFERAEQSETLFDARMWCLDRRHEELAALLTAFEQPDEEVVLAAVGASRQLGLLEDCANERLLRAQIDRAAAGDVPVAPPELYARLAQTQAKQRTAKFADALRDATALAAEADEGGYLALAGPAHLLVASVQDQLANNKEAEAAAHTAIVRSEAAGDAEARARAQSTLVSLLTQRHALEDAELWVRLTRATLSRLGDPPAPLATLLAHESELLNKAGRYKDSLRLRRESLALRQAYLEPDDPLLANNHEGIGNTLVELGQTEEGLGELRSALALRISALGAFHPDVARTHVAIGHALQDLGRMPEAIEESERAIELTIRALGPEHPDVGVANASLAIALAQQPEPARSIPYFREAIRVFEAAEGPDSLAVGYQLGNLGRVLAFDAMADDAVPTLQRALSIYTEVLGPEHPDNLHVLNSLTTALSMREHYAEALPFASRAVQVGTKAFDGDHPALADAWMRLGIARRRGGEPDRAVAALVTAAEMFTRLDMRPAAAAQARMELARVHLGNGDKASAIKLLEGVRDALVADPMAHTRWLGEVEAWLADPSQPL